MVGLSLWLFAREGLLACCDEKLVDFEGVGRFGGGGGDAEEVVDRQADFVCFEAFLLVDVDFEVGEGLFDGDLGGAA